MRRCLFMHRMAMRILSNDIFYTQNQAKLGDTGQALIEYNNDLYAIISGSRYLIRMNTAGVEKINVMRFLHQKVILVIW